jgi:chemotaxis response regulator CheB
MGKAKSKVDGERAGKQPSLLQSSIPIIAIGASAGGLEVIEAFLRKMPPDSGMALVIVTHLDRNHISLMPDLIKKFTAMKLKRIQFDWLSGGNNHGQSIS